MDESIVDLIPVKIGVSRDLKIRKGKVHHSRTPLFMRQSRQNESTDHSSLGSILWRVFGEYWRTFIKMWTWCTALSMVVRSLMERLSFSPFLTFELNPSRVDCTSCRERFKTFICSRERRSCSMNRSMMKRIFLPRPWTLRSFTTI